MADREQVNAHTRHEPSARAAEDALLDRTLFVLDDEAWEAFLARLDAPPRCNDRLRRTLATPAPWEAS